MSETILSKALVGNDNNFVRRKLRLTEEEWDFLGDLAFHWFGKRDMKKWAIARLCEEIRLLFTPPPTNYTKPRVLQIRKQDLELLLVLKKLFNIDHTSGALRSILYTIEDAPEHMFINSNNEYDMNFEHLWMRKILNKLKGKATKLKSYLFTTKQSIKPIGRCKVRRLLMQAEVEREIENDDRRIG